MSYRVHLWSECLAPMTHMKGVEGNEALIAREPVSTPAGVRWVPCLSANAIRHRVVREPGGLWLIDALGLTGRLSLLQLNFLLHGGNLTDSTGREDTARIAEMQELFPLLRLMGGALPDQILAGSLAAWRGLLVCEENRPHLPANLPAEFLAELPAAALKPAEHFVADYQYTRGDAARRPDLYDPETRDPDAKSNLMIFSGQQVIRGAVFAHGFEIARGSELEYGCLMHAVGLWQEQGGSVGGMASKGHGRLGTVVLGGADPAPAVAAYVAHVAANADRCRAWLDKVFARKAEKAAKGKAKKPAEEPADVG